MHIDVQLGAGCEDFMWGNRGGHVCVQITGSWGHAGDHAAV